MAMPSTAQQVNPQQTLQETSTSATLDYTFSDAIH